MITRNSWLDIAKGIAIILMVLGHSSLPDVVERFIFAFHMPLFFIASGYTTNWNKYSLKEYFLHKCKTLMLPFAIYSAIVLLLLQGIGALDWRHLLSHGWEGYALWFIPVLFIALMLRRIAEKLPPPICNVLIFIVLPIVGALLSNFHITLPWTLCAVPYATFLISIGTVMRRFDNRIASPNWWLLLASAIICFCVSSFWQLSMAWNQIMPIIPITIGAIAGTLMIFMLSGYIERNSSRLSSLFQSIGKETYIVVAFSQVIIKIVNHYWMINPLVKYLLLVLMLLVLKLCKDQVNKFLHYKIL
jgi:fucose 4-O-acetylase-like acetyltransferase